MSNHDIDVLIATKVMGWTDLIIMDDYPKIAINRPFEDPMEFSPSTNIEDAWKVVEKFKKFEVHRHMNDRYLAYAKTDYEDWVSVNQPTAPLAICLAALQAIGVEIK